MDSDSFSLISLTSLCTSIMHRTISSREELNDLMTIAATDTQNASTVQLSAFAAVLEQLIQQTTGLEKSLSAATAIGGSLQSCIGQALGACDVTTAVVNKQVMRLQPDNLNDVDEAFFIVYNDELAANNELFEFFSNLLALTDKSDQEAILDTTDGKKILEHTQMAGLQAAQIKEIFISGRAPEKDGSGSVHRPRPSQGSPIGDEPPPYEPEPQPEPNDAETSPISSQPAECTNSPSTISKGVNSLTKSFKAFAAGFGTKPDPLVSTLCQAALRGDIQQMSGLLAQNANVNGRNDEGHTPLSCAIMGNQVDATRFLLERGADRTSSDGSKMPPLFLAASHGNIEIAQLLIDMGAKANEKSWSGQPYFVDAVGSGNMDGIRFLLDNGASANASSLASKSVISNAVKKGNYEVVKLLLEHGAKVNSSDDHGSPLVAIAAGKNNLEMLRLLLDYGGSPSSRSYTGSPAIIDAISKQRLEVAKLLIEQGADANVRDLYGHPLLISLVRHPRMEENDKVELVQMLLKNGASPDVSDSTWGTPFICCAIELGNSKILSLSLEHGASTNKKMSNGETLILYAMDRGRRDQVVALLQGGADPNMPDKRGRVPLMSALAKQDVELIRALKNHGADLNVEGKVSAADFAHTLGKPEIFEALGMDPATTPRTPTGFEVPLSSPVLESPRIARRESQPKTPGCEAAKGKP